MDTNNHVFISWEEHVVYQGKGCRVVHYYLKDTSGELILVVVGTERSTRHILYVVAEDYLDAFGHTNPVNADTKSDGSQACGTEDNKMVSTSKHSVEKQDIDVLKLKKRWCIDFLAGNKN